MNELFQDAVNYLKMTLNKSEKIDNTEKQYRYEHSMRVASISFLHSFPCGWQSRI